MNRWNAISACVLLCLCGAAAAQQVATAETDGAAAPAVDEEIVVRGSSRTALRVQIELAEDAIFERFNAINSHDEFDIRCRLETSTGTRIPQRVCQANFWRDALRESGESTVRQLQGSSDVGESIYRAQALYKTRLLEAEMTRLASEDAELIGAITRLHDLTTALENFGDSGERRNETTARVATASDQTLPYEAAVMADVRIHRKPWSHTLSHSTFTIAHVFGEIESVSLQCSERAHELEFEPGTEWQVPRDWEPCSVTVEAGRGTAFSLFEFD